LLIILQFEEGSKISADYEGYFLGPGSVDSKTFPNNGMSYGGKGGGKESLVLYGSALRPIDLGSGVDLLIEVGVLSG
jgi:hypothetical protein